MEELLCRTCAAPCDNSISLFSKDTTFSEGHLKAGSSKDLLPNWLCEECLRRLKDGVSFLKTVIESHSKLLVYLKKVRSKPKEETYLEVAEDHLFDEDECALDEDSIQPKEAEIKQKPVFTCNQCSREFTRKEKLKCHMRIHSNERPYKCEHCSQSFRQLNALKCHRRTHTGDKPFKCHWPGCLKTFSQNTILKTHMTLHTGKTVKCDQCDKLFSRPSYLIQHRREHTGERPYICHLCPATYKQKSHLDHHLSVHSGVKFPCEVCGKSYSKKWSLKVHMYSHQVDHKMPYACTVCERSFPLKSKLLAHVKLKHQPVEEVAETVVQVICVDTNEQIIWQKGTTLE